jgi:hypothetical protein
LVSSELLAGHGGEEELRLGTLSWLVVSPGRPWRRGGAASCSGGSAWQGRGGGGVGFSGRGVPVPSLCADSMVEAVAQSLVVHGVLLELGASLRRLVAACSVASSGPEGSRATAPEASLCPCRISPASSPQVARPRWCSGGQSSEASSVFLEKIWRTGSRFFARSGVFCALLLDLCEISLFFGFLFCNCAPTRSVMKPLRGSFATPPL